MLRRPLSSIELKTDDIEHMERVMIEVISSQNPLIKSEHDIKPPVASSVVGCSVETVLESGTVTTPVLTSDVFSVNISQE